MTINNQDKKYMRRALELARLAEGWTSPNPLVGAVLVRDGQVVGEGYHQAAGTPHAEIHALRAAGEKAYQSTAYVTLEPCSHYGRTPPCSKALIEAGVNRVVMAMTDPNPLVSGRGATMLQEAGIAVDVGVLEEEAAILNRPFIKYITTGQPLVAAKMAVSIDGKIATRSGSSQWITGEKARSAGRYLRHVYDAILVGSGTILADNPQLTVRLDGIKTKNPLRIVLDGSLRIPLDSRVLKVGEAETLIVTTEASSDKKKKEMEQLGVKLLVQPGSGKIDLPWLLKSLGKLEVTAILVEGGGQVHGSFFEQDMVDIIHLYLAPKIIGGSEAPGPVGGLGVNKVDQARKYRMVKTEQHDEDLGITYVRC